MPKPTAVSLREAIWKRSQQGIPNAQIARELDLPARTVRKLVAEFRSHPQKVRPSYERCGRPRSASMDTLQSQAVALRQQHPHWGAGLIRALLQEQHDETLPAVRTFRRWFAQAGWSQASCQAETRARSSHRPRADRPHAVWQVDGVEELTLTGGDQVCWVRAVDEHTGAVLGTVVFSPKLFGPGRSPTCLGSIQKLV